MYRDLHQNILFKCVSIYFISLDFKLDSCARMCLYSLLLVLFSLRQCVKTTTNVTWSNKWPMAKTSHLILRHEINRRQMCRVHIIQFFISFHIVVRAHSFDSFLLIVVKVCSQQLALSSDDYTKCTLHKNRNRRTCIGGGGTNIKGTDTKSTKMI